MCPIKDCSREDEDRKSWGLEFAVQSVQELSRYSSPFLGSRVTFERVMELHQPLFVELEILERKAIRLGERVDAQISCADTAPS